MQKSGYDHHFRESTKAGIMEVIVFVRASGDSGAGIMLSTELLAFMNAYAGR